MIENWILSYTEDCDVCYGPLLQLQHFGVMEVAIWKKDRNHSTRPANEDM